MLNAVQLITFRDGENLQVWQRPFSLEHGLPSDDGRSTILYLGRSEKRAGEATLIARKALDAAGYELVTGERTGIVYRIPE